MSSNEAAGKKKWIRDTDGIKKPVTVDRGKVNLEKVKMMYGKKELNCGVPVQMKHRNVTKILMKF